MERAVGTKEGQKDEISKAVSPSEFTVKLDVRRNAQFRDEAGTRVLLAKVPK